MQYNRRMVKAFFVWPFIAALAWTSAPAMADIVLDFSFQALASKYDPTGATTGTFVTKSTSDLLGNGKIWTNGTVSRLVEPEGTAGFSWKPGTGFGLAQVQVTMSLTNINRVANTADAEGMLEMFDIDGDLIAGNLSGKWSLGAAQQAHFSGSVHGIVFVPPTGGTFDGNNFFAGDGFSMDFTEFDQILGSFLDMTDIKGDFFEVAFGFDEGRASSIEAHIIPIPGAAILGAVGLGLVGLLRKRVTRD